MPQVGKVLKTMALVHPRCDVRECPVCKAKEVHVASHRCFIQPIKRLPDVEPMPFHLCFFDFEAQCLDAHHVVKKVVAVLVCHRCAHTFYRLCSRGCTFCGRERLHVFDTMEAFGRCFMGPENETLRLYMFLAHNFKGYDSYPILEWLIREHYLPNGIYQGAKIMMMTVEGLTFKELPITKKSRGLGTSLLELIRQENKRYVGPDPPLDDYGIDDMESMDQEALRTWWEEVRRRTGDVFDFQRELLEYCIQDVMVLTRGCLKFHELYAELFRVDPFQECVTIAGTCLTVLKKNYLRENTLGWCPHSATVTATCNRSKRWNGSGRWVVARGFGGGAIRTEKRRSSAKVDGYDPDTRTVYQYHGCVFHGCPRCFQQNRQRVYFPTGRTMEDLHDKTVARTRALRGAGYRVVERWGHEWDVEWEQHRPFPAWIADQTPIFPREALIGGRTNAITLYAA
ncbi:hypothetical protein QZH41_004491 [Actinostola sp. cb2023]|nr:hypothetical protein QZH41_004491 [Actinostola sp. cb2023]